MVFQKGSPVEFTFRGEEEAVDLPKGSYSFQLWGAQGGTNNLTSARGGYVSGNILFTQKTTIFITVGGKGEFASTVAKGGFNGGGDALIGTTKSKAGGGGGATDIRLSTNRIESRILVAGGGGGDGYYHSQLSGGSGGGEEGADGQDTRSSEKLYGKKGTQTQPGLGLTYTANGITVSSEDGTFGNGGTGTGIAWSGGGGGAGYFGGSGSYESGSGGGSGFVSPLAKFPILLRGDQITGDLENTGDGKVIITLLSFYNEITCSASRKLSIFGLISIFLIEPK